MGRTVGRVERNFFLNVIHKLGFTTRGLALETHLPTLKIVFATLQDKLSTLFRTPNIIDKQK